MAYAFGAAGAAAPPPAGAGAAALSSAAFTAWPLKVRVGANSPSLCPIICSVTYTGINFLPLCTAMVWPMKSGTIVERRDQVLTTFFSLRVFSPSTFSRRCPSTNGPFFSERAISLLFLDAAQTSPRGVPHLLESTYRSGNAVRLRAERANEPRSHGIRRAVHNHRPSRLAKLVQRRFQRNRRLFLQQHRSLYDWLRDRFRRRPFCYTLARPLRAAAYRCPASCCTACSCRSHRFRSSFAVCLSRECSPSTAYKVSLLSALDNVLVGALIVPGLLAQRRERPRRLRVIALDAAFTTAVRVIHRIHRYAANRRTNTLPARTSSLAVSLVLVVQIADLANCRHTINCELADFARRQLDQRQVAFLAEQLRGSSRCAHQLAATAWIQFNVVHHRARRNVAKLQSVARKDVSVLAGIDRRANFQTHRMQNVALVAIGVVQQRDVGAAVRVVFNGFDLGRHTVFIAAEINLAVLLLVAATAVPYGNFALVVTSARALFRFQETLFRSLLGDMAFVENGHKQSRPRIWIKALQSHLCLLPCSSRRPAPAALYFLTCCLTRLTNSPRLQILRKLDHLFAFGQLYVGFLPVAAISFGLPAAAHFSVEICGTHAGYFHLENLLHGFLDLRLGSFGGNFEYHRALNFFYAETFFRDDRAANNLIVRG